MSAGRRTPCMRTVAAVVIGLVSTLGAGALTVSAVGADDAPTRAAVEPAAAQAGGLHAGHVPGEPFWSWEKD